MQLWYIDEPVVAIMIEILIAFLLIIGVGLYRFSRGVMYRLMSAAWILFSLSTTLVLFTTSLLGLSPIDALATGGMMVSALLLVDGTHERRRRYSLDVILYPIVFVIGFVLVPIGLAMNLTYGVVFTPSAIFTCYACWSSAKQFMKKPLTRNIDFWTLILGLIVWGSTMLLFPIGIFVDVLHIQLILLTTGFIMTGAGMLNVFIRETTEDLSVQYAITQLMSGIINHDIRNYVGTLQESTRQMKTEGSDHEFWLNLTSEAVENMAEFVEEIRHFSAGFSRFEAEREPIRLTDLLRDVKTRVTNEYSLSTDSIEIAVDEDVFVLTNRIIREMFWNIVDNSFKHNSQNVRIEDKSQTSKVVTLEISDDAGGLPKDVLDFLNDPDSISGPSAPGMGLGVILIKGLSILCGGQLTVKVISREDKPIGTVFRLNLIQHLQSSSNESTRMV